MLKAITDLIPDNKNANKGNERGRKAVRESLERLGAGRSIVLDRNGRIIAGNKTVEGAKAAGLENIVTVETDGSQLVAVVRTDLDLDDPKARELAIADNRTAELGLEWDGPVLKELSSELDLKPYFSPEELHEILPHEFGGEQAEESPAPLDKADELCKKWKVESEQIWEIPSNTTKGKRHRIMCGDSAKESDVTALFNRERAALIATDPPYGVAYGVETGASEKYSAIANDENDGPRLQAFLESVFRAAVPHLREDAAWYLWHAQLTQGFFAAAAAAAGGIKIHRQIIWVKPTLVLGHGDYHWRHELCFYGWREGHRARWLGDRKQTTVWEIGRESDGLHPTQKPLELFIRPMQFNTLPGELCYEPFSGSGSQLCAAERTGRICYAMEIEPKYVAVALERLAKLGLEPRLSNGR